MRFNFDAYEKVYPAEKEIQPDIESAVDTFKPTATEKAGGDPAGDTMKTIPEEPTPESTPAEMPESAEMPEGVKDE